MRPPYPLIGICALAFGLSYGSFLAFGDAYINTLDEGFLWYGTLQTLAGQLPVRDFQSYDPGRYYWCAAWSTLFGPGLLALRMSLAIFQAIGLACGLLAARRVVSHQWLLVPIGIAIATWQQPHFKVFESSLAMIAVLLGARLVERPTLARYLVCGLVVGIASFFGRNLGLYIGLGTLLVIVLLAWRGTQRLEPRGVCSWAVGVVAAGRRPGDGC